CEAILEAFRSPWIKPVAVKSQEQQAILALHRAREQWKDTRTMRINGIRGMLREFGIVAPKGADRFLARLPQLLESHRTRLPEAIRRLVHAYTIGSRRANDPSWPGRMRVPHQRPDIRMQPHPPPPRSPFTLTAGR